VRKALSCAYRTGQRFGVVHLIDVLRGKDTERIRRWQHEALSVFGIGNELEETTWRGVFRQQPAAKGSRKPAVARRHSAAAPQKPRQAAPRSAIRHWHSRCWIA